MAFYEHLSQFAGLSVVDWNPESGAIAAGQAARIALSYDAAEEGQLWTDLFVALLDQPNVAELEGLVVGAWGMMFEQTMDEAGRAVEAIVAARDRLPKLRAIFFGDVISEECEVSWIENTDVSPLLAAYPQLEHFGVRGTNNLSFGALQHPNLRSLIVQTGGLDVRIVRSVAAADLPALEHLELWLGTGGYGGNVTVDDLAPILAGGRFPRLRYLGLRNSEIADEIAAAVVDAPVLEQIRVLDLSLGTFGDDGAEALLASPAIARLEKLDLHHHFCSPEMIARLAALPLEVDTSDLQEPDSYGGELFRFVSVGE